MNAYTAQHEMAFDTETLRSTTDRRTAHGTESRLAAVVRWVIEFPRRRAVIDELRSLSDHELADIGLERDEVARVFDRGFAAQRAV